MKLKITIQAALAFFFFEDIDCGGAKLVFFWGGGGESGDLPPRIQDLVVTRDDLKKT